MDVLWMVVIAATLLCSLVAGFVFAFAVVVMPGIRSLGDLEFLQAFRAMDGVIQRNQPLFVIVWLGSIVAVVVAGVLGVGQLEGIDRVLLIAAAAVYLLGVQVPTMTINVPLNNRLQAEKLDGMTGDQIREVRLNFESPWIRWNAIRTVLAVISVTLWIVLILRLSSHYTTKLHRRNMLKVS